MKPTIFGVIRLSEYRNNLNTSIQKQVYQNRRQTQISYRRITVSCAEPKSNKSRLAASLVITTVSSTRWKQTAKYNNMQIKYDNTWTTSLPNNARLTSHAQLCYDLPSYLDREKSTYGYRTQRPEDLLELPNTPSMETNNNLRIGKSGLFSYCCHQSIATKQKSSTPAAIIILKKTTEYLSTSSEE